MDYDFSSDSSKEILEDQKNEKNIAALESIFSSTDNLDNGFLEDSTNYIDNKFSDSFSNNVSDLNFDDPLEKTSSINELDLEQLREYSNKLRSIVNEENDSFTNNDSGMDKGGKQKVLTTKPVPKYGEDVSQILSSFISCSVLSFVTAAMGVGFILNIVLQIK